jgi:hypothetical protein
LPWTGTTLLALWRTLTGRGSTDDISDADALVIINDYYQEDFPFEVHDHQIEADWTVQGLPTDNGEYTIADTELELGEPITANEFDLVLYQDKQQFFEDYPENEDEDFITSPTLAIGTTPQNVLNAACKFQIGDNIYDLASAETALSGDDVPQNTYGAWLLSVDVDGTITITAASSNGTGYANAALAIAGITLPGAAYADLGFVTAINSGGAFSPGTTALDAGTVTDTYTDGDPTLRNIPAACCLANGNLVVRPKPNDQFLIRAKCSFTSGSAITAGTSPTNEHHGMAIALGSAIKFLTRVGDMEKVAELLGPTTADIPGTFRYHKTVINRKRSRQQRNRQIARNW